MRNVLRLLQNKQLKSKTFYLAFYRDEKRKTKNDTFKLNVDEKTYLFP